MTMFGDFLRNDHRRSHKWHQYFPVYERHLERFRNRHVTLIEVGLGEGGSLQMWRRFLGPFAIIVGIDIDPVCSRYQAEDQIHIRIGSQADPEFLRSVLDEFGPPDIFIDDGSHIQQHINTTFDVFYPHVAKNGVYLVEDLHAAYWPNHGAGLRHPESFIEKAKSYIDDMHAQYTGGELPRSALGDRTTSIHFYDSIIALEVGEHRVPTHSVTGDATLFASPAELPPPKPAPVQPPTRAETADREQATANVLRERVAELERELVVLRESTSWKVTGPLRGAGRILKS